MSYKTSVFAELDPVIKQWVKATRSTLFTEWNGQDSRFFHIPGNPPFECFQIAVFSPDSGKVVVQAASIDTNDDAEMLKLWDGETANLDHLLGQAVQTIEHWKSRLQTPRDLS